MRNRNIKRAETAHILSHDFACVNQDQGAAIRRSFNMKNAPATGPAVNNINAHRHPITDAASGKTCIETTVTANPTPFCTVNAVPVYSGGQCRAANAENCGESDTTKTPHIMIKTSSKAAGSENESAESAQQAPLMVNDAIATVISPARRDIHPPTAQPMAPAPIVIKATRGR